MPQTEIRRISNTNSGSPNVSLTRYKNNKRRGMFACQKWHKLYAELLIESKVAFLPDRIRLAAQAMFLRYIELRGAHDREEELLDLRRGVAVLSEITVELEIANSTRRFAARALTPPNVE